MKDLEAKPLTYKNKEQVAIFIPRQYLLMSQLEGYSFILPKSIAEKWSDEICIAAIEHDYKRPS
jgi:hypothetical protein